MFPSSTFRPHYELYPKSYDAQKYIRDTPFVIDGDISKKVWSNIEWSEKFSDIIGDNEDESVPPPEDCRTRFKMVWDDEYLYIAFLLESYNRTVVSSYTDRNSPIYQRDSDIEVFLDPLGCCHSYKELELNAFNTVWNLMLDKPYDDGGKEHSGRVASPGDKMYYEVNNQKTATKLIWGQFNDPRGAVWSVEMALSHKDTLSRYTDDEKKRLWPQVDRKWRINFSRVEEKGKINWTWSPQIIWDPQLKKFSGKVAMHLPDVWGYVNFVNSKEAIKKTFSHQLSSQSSNLDSTWPARLAAMNYYYAQSFFRKQNGHYCSTITQLEELLNHTIVSPFHVNLFITKTGREGAALNYRISVHDKTGIVVNVTDDRYLSVDSS